MKAGSGAGRVLTESLKILDGHKQLFGPRTWGKSVLDG